MILSPLNYHRVFIQTEVVKSIRYDPNYGDDYVYFASHTDGTLTLRPILGFPEGFRITVVNPLNGVIVFLPAYGLLTPYSVGAGGKVDFYFDGTYWR